MGMDGIHFLCAQRPAAPVPKLGVVGSEWVGAVGGGGRVTTSRRRAPGGSVTESTRDGTVTVTGRTRRGGKTRS